jgi:hypothetical protein
MNQIVLRGWPTHSHFSLYDGSKLDDTTAIIHR